MAETTKTEQVFYTKEFDRYDNSENNFVTNQELTVTITLNEYRKLIADGATTAERINKADRDRWEAKTELDKANAEISKLRAIIYNLQNNNPASFDADGEID